MYSPAKFIAWSPTPASAEVDDPHDPLLPRTVEDVAGSEIPVAQNVGEGEVISVLKKRDELPRRPPAGVCGQLGVDDLLDAGENLAPDGLRFRRLQRVVDGLRRDSVERLQKGCQILGQAVDGSVIVDLRESLRPQRIARQFAIADERPAHLRVVQVVIDVVRCRQWKLRADDVQNGLLATQRGDALWLFVGSERAVRG